METTFDPAIEFHKRMRRVQEALKELSRSLYNERDRVRDDKRLSAKNRAERLEYIEREIRAVRHEHRVFQKLIHAEDADRYSILFNGTADITNQVTGESYTADAREAG